MQQNPLACVDLFQAIRSGLLDVQVGRIRPLSEAVEAHRDLEARRTTGATVFTV